MTTAVQTTWTAEPSLGRPGQVANLGFCRIDSRIVETAAGIGFGLAVGRGAADNGCVLGQGADAGATPWISAEFVGVTVLDPTRYPVDRAATDEYAHRDVAAVLSEGDIWVSPDGAVSDGDNVTFNRTTGRLSSAAAAAGQPQVNGAVWMTTAAANGIARLRLTGTLGTTA